MDSSAEFLIQVLQSFGVFGVRLYVNIAFIGPLYQYLTGDILPAAINDLLFQLVIDWDRVGYNIGLAGFKHLDQAGRILGDLDV